MMEVLRSPVVVDAGSVGVGDCNPAALLAPMAAYASAPCTLAADHCLRPPAALPCTAKMSPAVLSRYR